MRSIQRKFHSPFDTHHQKIEKLGLATKPLLGKLLVGDSWSLKDLGREEEGGEEG